MNCVAGADTVKNKNTGGNNEDIFIVKYDPSGTVAWATGAGGIYRDIPNGISVDPSGNANVTGYTTNSTLSFGTLSLTCTGSYNDIFIAKLGGFAGIDEKSDQADILIYPNPSSGTLYVKNNSNVFPFNKITITDLMGRIILEKESNETETKIDLTAQSKGVYFCTVSCRKSTLVHKVVIQ
jgi:hypothetical protein